MSSNDVNMQRAIFASLQSSRPPPAASRPLPATRTSFTSTFGEPSDSMTLFLFWCCCVRLRQSLLQKTRSPKLTWIPPSSPQPPRGAAQYPDVLRFLLIQSGHQRNQGGVSIRFREKGYPRYLVRRHPQGRLPRLREAEGRL